MMPGLDRTHHGATHLRLASARCPCAIDCMLMEPGITLQGSAALLLQQLSWQNVSIAVAVVQQLSLLLQELAWEGEKKRLAVAKLRKYFLDDLEVEHIVLHAFRYCQLHLLLLCSGILMLTFFSVSKVSLYLRTLVSLHSCLLSAVHSRLHLLPVLFCCSQLP